MCDVCRVCAVRTLGFRSLGRPAPRPRRESSRIFPFSQLSVCTPGGLAGGRGCVRAVWGGPGCACAHYSKCRIRLYFQIFIVMGKGRRRVCHSQCATGRTGHAPQCPELPPQPPPPTHLTMQRCSPHRPIKAVRGAARDWATASGLRRRLPQHLPHPRVGLLAIELALVRLHQRTHDLHVV